MTQENGENGEEGGSPSKKESPSKAKKAKKSFFPPDHLFKYELEELEDESSDEEEEDDDDEVQEVGENGEKKKKQKERKAPEVRQARSEPTILNYLSKCMFFFKLAFLYYKSDEPSPTIKGSQLENTCSWVRIVGIIFMS